TGSFKSVEEISKTLTTTAVCGLARCVKKDIDAVCQSTKEAVKPRIHVFLATRPIHRDSKLMMYKEEVLTSIKEHVAYASEYFNEVQFSLEIATRTELPFLIECEQTAVDEGASVINIHDTVGFSYPTEYGKIFKTLQKNVKTNHEVIYSAHCHDDLGLAVANSMAAIENGAKRIEGTLNGISEREGKTALEEVALGLYV